MVKTALDSLSDYCTLKSALAPNAAEACYDGTEIRTTGASEMRLCVQAFLARDSLAFNQQNFGQIADNRVRCSEGASASSGERAKP